MTVILIVLLEDFKFLLAVLPTSKPKRPGLVKPGTRPRAPEGLEALMALPRDCLKPDIASTKHIPASTLKSDAYSDV
jgi:hypothetical protein